MPLLNVYVEGTKEQTRDGVRRVAAQIASRYDLSAAELEKRLAAGRFRVKANVDEETAKAFAADLESLGARCTIVAAGGNPASRAALVFPHHDLAGATLTGIPPITELADHEPQEPAAVPAPPPVLARPGALPASAVAPPATSRTMTLPWRPPPPATRTPPAAAAAEPPAPAAPPAAAAPPAPAATPAAPIGLAAALADATFSSGLGALDTATFSLATLDERQEDAAPASPAMTTLPGTGRVAPRQSAPGLPLTAPTPPPFDQPPSPQLAPQRPQLAQPPPQRPAPTASPYSAQAQPDLRWSNAELPPPGTDRFAPPPQERSFALEAPRAVRGALAPEGAPMMAPAIAAPYAPATSSGDDPRRRGRIPFFAGILLSVFIGFAPAHLMAKGRERAAFERIDNRVRAAQTDVTTIEEWKALDDIRTARMRDKHAAQQEIALLAILLWLAISASFAVGWTRWVVPRLTPVE
ncbi:MAG: hypothetical protein IPI49_20185 [Myxococcales bacterium]|nr:hypothetical protein [Myxococcales bacterium]